MNGGCATDRDAPACTYCGKPVTIWPPVSWVGRATLLLHPRCARRLADDLGVAAQELLTVEAAPGRRP